VTGLVFVAATTKGEVAMYRSVWLLAAVVAVAGACLAAPALAGAVTFSNSGAITIPAFGTSGPADPYPSTIDVSGVAGTITDVNVTLTGYSHTFPSDVGVLLVGPTGANVALMVRPRVVSSGTAVTLTFDDDAASPLNCGDTIVTIVGGAFKPNNCAPSGSFAAPAPAAPYGAALSAFNGTDANGTWRLYVEDFAPGDVGAISGGWSLDIMHTVAFNFTGFLQPVSNPPTVNVVNAGQGVPIKFSLAGDQGLNIFAAGSPTSAQVECDTGAPLGAAQTADSNDFSFDPLTDTYTLVWKTDKAWEGTCRQFSLGLNDGSSHVATFQFK
jgi:hypothetical protein